MKEQISIFLGCDPVTLKEKIRELPPEKKEIVEKASDSLLAKFEWVRVLKRIGKDDVYWQL